MSRTIPTYRTYKFTDQDPVVDAIRTMVNDAGLTDRQISEKSGVSYQTLRNWWNETTNRPQYATLNAVAMSCGHELRPVPITQNTRAGVVKRAYKRSRSILQPQEGTGI